MVCPKCGNQEFKEVTENSQQKYKRCGNCHYSPALEKAEPVDAKTWIEGVAKEYAEAVEALRQADLALAEKESTLTLGKFNKAKRVLTLSEQKMVIAEAVSTIIEMNQEGQITLLLPGMGLFQFEWGNFDLFEAISKEKE